MAVAAPIAVAAVGLGVSIYEGNEASKNADKALDASRRPQVAAPKKPNGMADTATEVEKANMLAQTAGGSLLSDPAEDARSGKAIGTVPGNGKSLLGS